MTRPVHVVEQAAAATTPALLAYLADRDRDVLLVGGPPLLEMAASVGLSPLGRVPAAKGRGAWGWPALCRWCAKQGVGRVDNHLENEADQNKRPLYSWSINLAVGLQGLSLLGGPRAAAVCLYTRPSARDNRRLRRLDTQAITVSEALRESVVADGLAPGRVATDAFPAAKQSERSRARLVGERATLREAWGVDEDLPVVALLGDPPDAAEAYHSMMAISHVAEATGRDLRLLVHPRQYLRVRKQSVLEMYGHPARYLQDARIGRPWEILAGCDAVIAGDQTAPLSLAHALGAGVPIVAADRPDHREALGSADHVFWAQSARAKHLAHRLQHDALDLPTIHIDLPLPMPTVSLE
ncbi:MAG: hypothetical protein AAGG38_03240 [Planctomycetota bacterium]